jgi:hypothetical protein
MRGRVCACVCACRRYGNNGNTWNRTISRACKAVFVPMGWEQAGTNAIIRANR